MSELSGEPPSGVRFDDFLEISANGRVVLRVEALSDLESSPVDEAVIGQVLKLLVERSEEDFEDESGLDFEEVLSDVDPDVRIFDSDVGEWEELTLDY